MIDDETRTEIKEIVRGVVAEIFQPKIITIEYLCLRESTNLPHHFTKAFGRFESAKSASYFIPVQENELVEGEDVSKGIFGGKKRTPTQTLVIGEQIKFNAVNLTTTDMSGVAKGKRREDFVPFLDFDRLMHLYVLAKDSPGISHIDVAGVQKDVCEQFLRRHELSNKRMEDIAQQRTLSERLYDKARHFRRSTRINRCDYLLKSTP